jgi:disulfide bond formation protein DsbB
MTELIQTTLPYKVLVSHILLVVIILAFIFGKSWGSGIVRFLGKNSVLLGFLVSLGAVIGSLFYSNVVGFEPCVLCWWQRVFLYPTALILGIALWKKDKGVFRYVSPLAVLGGIVALYQSYANMGWGSILPCTAEGGACSKLYVFAFGYITIPVMSLTICLYLLVIAWANKIYSRNENSNS